MERYNNYCIEVESLKRKMKNGVPPRKRRKYQYRINDIEKRLIPRIIMEWQNNQISNRPDLGPLF